MNVFHKSINIYKWTQSNFSFSENHISFVSLNIILFSFYENSISPKIILPVPPTPISRRHRSVSLSPSLLIFFDVHRSILNGEYNLILYIILKF